MRRLAQQQQQRRHGDGQHQQHLEIIVVGNHLGLPGHLAVERGQAFHRRDVERQFRLQMPAEGLQLIGQLPPAMSGQLRRGMRVQILSAITGRTTTGVVSSVGRTVVNPGHGGTAYAPVRVSSLHGWAASWDGQNVQLTVTAAATSGPVLAVPEAAISASADGVTSVTVVEHGGGTRRVRVRTGASANGLVQVTPVGAKLAPGDLVVVGG